MAEGIANKILPDMVIESAGTEAHGVNPMAILVMNEISIPIAHHKSKKIDFNKIKDFDIVITLCGDAKDKCPVFDSKTRHIHLGVEDPAIFIGNAYETNKKYAEVRDILYDKIIKFKKQLGDL